MARMLSMIEARSRLTSLPEEFANEPEAEAIAVTRRGKPVLALLPWELYESFVETLEILGDDELMRALRRSIGEARNRKTIPWEKAKRKLRL